MNKIVSVLRGRSFSTSALSLLIMNGLNSRCNCSTNICVLSRSDDCKLNSSSKRSAEANTSGSRKLSRAQSSCKLFWSGVPVTNNRFSVFSNLTVFDSCARSFLMRCACADRYRPNGPKIGKETTHGLLSWRRRV